ncbi:hypothetical protein ACFP63_08495 [Oerskovia jenensis]|uniref:Lipoprotein n=1 Tax=Oerskovia jenensis TaxID=162169 RepID=A0ABS2LI51_9CELL|nr:hypothetical protein [Oerskovia jenensis]MBM7480090.1 hypothetical protein [Oerskovia jenensis]
MRRVAVYAVLLSGVFLTVACSGESDPEAHDRVVSYATFTAALQEGADCPALFEIRNRMEPEDPAIDDANEDLRSVECYSATSSRKG